MLYVVLTKSLQRLVNIVVFASLQLWELVRVIALIHSFTAAAKYLKAATEGRGFTAAHSLRVQAVIDGKAWRLGTWGLHLRSRGR